MISVKSRLEGKALKASTTFTFLSGWGMERGGEKSVTNQFFSFTERLICRLLGRMDLKGNAGSVLSWLVFATMPNFRPLIVPIKETKMGASKSWTWCIKAYTDKYSHELPTDRWSSRAAGNPRTGWPFTIQCFSPLHPRAPAHLTDTSRVTGILCAPLAGL